MSFQIIHSWIDLNENNDPEDRYIRKTYAEIQIIADGNNLVAMTDEMTKRTDFLTSGYLFGSFLLDNYWDILYEDNVEKEDDDWGQRHQMINIGEGYVWPHITLYGDPKERLVHIETKGYKGEYTTITFHHSGTYQIPHAAFEREAGLFICQLANRLSEHHEHPDNFFERYEQWQSERQNPAFLKRMIDK